MSRKKVSKVSKEKKAFSSSYLDKLENQVQSNQSKVSLILGALIVVVIGILVFNYFNKSKATLGPAQQTEVGQDVSPTALPGKYTVKEGDTLFTIAEKYYQDGFQYAEIAKKNNLVNPDEVITGQVLEIPKLETAQAQASVKPSAQPSSIAEASPTSSQEEVIGTGTGGGNTTIWGPKIEGNTYTVQEGDWLSTIAARAYGDILAYERLAKANNILNPDHIEPGTVLTIPR